MTLTTDEVHVGMDLIDLLLKNTDETNSYHSNHLWTINIHDSPSPGESSADDFLESLLGGSDCSSAPASPLWSSGTTNSAGRPMESPASFRPMSENGGTQWSYSEPPRMENHPCPSRVKTENTADVAVDLGWGCTDLEEKFGLAYYLKGNHPSLRASNQHLTVKDLLLSNLGQKGQTVSQQSLQELVLDDDEKRLLAKEGVNLPNKLPLTKFEERVLKKIRRKIRNKRSAQESRKKKREYVDSLEGRMSACNAHNLELQRKIHQLEKTNKALLDQLSQLQSVLANNSKKATHKGTCILVLLLSFSLLISSNLRPDPSSQKSSWGDITETQVPSRSLLSLEVQETPPPPLSVLRGVEALRSGMEKIWFWTQQPVTDHRQRGHQ